VTGRWASGPANGLKAEAAGPSIGKKIKERKTGCSWSLGR
jgi:hypothetical protein